MARAFPLTVAAAVATISAALLALASAQSYFPCHPSKSSYNFDVECTRVVLPPGMCKRCALRPTLPDGRFEVCSRIYDTEAPDCPAALQEYVDANPCDQVRGEALPKMLAGDPDAVMVMDYFLYSLCEQCCDCVPMGISKSDYQSLAPAHSTASPALWKEDRGNCPAHAFYDVCKVLPHVTYFSKPGGPEKTAPKACSLLRDWQNSPDADEWQNNPETNLADDLREFLRGLLSASDCADSTIWGRCYDMENKQNHLELPEDYDPPATSPPSTAVTDTSTTTVAPTTTTASTNDPSTSTDSTSTTGTTTDAPATTATDGTESTTTTDSTETSTATGSTESTSTTDSTEPTTNTDGMESTTATAGTDTTTTPTVTDNTEISTTGSVETTITTGGAATTSTAETAISTDSPTTSSTDSSTTPSTSPPTLTTAITSTEGDSTSTEADTSTTEGETTDTTAAAEGGGGGDTGTADNSPTPTAAAESGGTCFPESATVELITGEFVSMGNLRIGDSVRVAKDTFSEVFLFSHRTSSTSAPAYVELATRGSNMTLTVTAGHYLHVNGGLMFAELVKVGDRLLSAKDGWVSVRSVRSVSGKGLFNPQTMNGDIVVDGFVASTYTSAVPQQVAVGLLAPLRALYRYGFVTEKMFGMFLKDGYRSVQKAL